VLAVRARRDLPVTAHRFSQADTNDTKQKRGDIRPIQHIIRYLRNVLTQALAGLGWIEGRNLQTHVRWGGGDAKIAQAHSEQVVGLKPDVILS